MQADIGTVVGYGKAMDETVCNTRVAVHLTDQAADTEVICTGSVAGSTDEVDILYLKVLDDRLKVLVATKLREETIMALARRVLQGNLDVGNLVTSTIEVRAETLTVGGSRTESPLGTSHVEVASQFVVFLVADSFVPVVVSDQVRHFLGRRDQERIFACAITL